MRSLEFCECFPPFGGRSGASSDPRWARKLIENFAQEGGQGGLSLGSLPIQGRGGLPHNNHRGVFKQLIY